MELEQIRYDKSEGIATITLNRPQRMNAFTPQMLAKELAPHRVNVNAVCPGSTDTDMMDGTFRRTGEQMGIPFEMVKQGVKQFIPLGRQAEPAEIAAVVAYLASPQADYITGQAISVDGGLVMG